MEATQLPETYWHWQVGRQIAEFEQGDKDRGEYGLALINRLSASLRLRHGNGFSCGNACNLPILGI